MYYRLAALPRSWVNADVFMLEDRVGRLYQYVPSRDRLERLDPGDANLLMQWYELSQSFTWHTRDELPQVFAVTTGRADRPSSEQETERLANCRC